MPKPALVNPEKCEVTGDMASALDDMLVAKDPTRALTSLLKTHRGEWTSAEFNGQKRVYLHWVGPDGVPLNAPREDAIGPPAVHLMLPPCQIKWATTEPSRMLSTDKAGNFDLERSPQETVAVMQPDDDRYNIAINKRFMEGTDALEYILNEDRISFLAKNEKHLKFMPNRFAQLKGDQDQLLKQMEMALHDPLNSLATAKRVLYPRSDGLVSPDWDRNRQNDPSQELTGACKRYLTELKTYFSGADAGDDAPKNLDAITKIEEMIQTSLIPSTDPKTGQALPMRRLKISPVVHYDSRGNVITPLQVQKYLKTRGAIASLEIKVQGLRCTKMQDSKKADPRVSLPVSLTAIRWFVNGKDRSATRKVVIDTSQIFGEGAMDVESDEEEPQAAPAGAGKSGAKNHSAGKHDDDDDDDDDGLDDAAFLAAAAEVSKAVQDVPEPLLASGSPKRTARTMEDSSKSRTHKSRSSKSKRAKSGPKSAAVISEADLDEEDGFVTSV